MKSDYAKWMLDDPRLNFAISQRGSMSGIDHLGFQVNNDTELAEMHDQLLAADAGLVEQKGTSCCYAHSDKYWVTDPQGIAWETFHTLDSVPIYGDSMPLKESSIQSQSSSCCAPKTERPKSISEKACC